MPPDQQVMGLYPARHWSFIFFFILAVMSKSEAVNYYNSIDEPFHLACEAAQLNYTVRF